MNIKGNKYIWLKILNKHILELENLSKDYFIKIPFYENLLFDDLINNFDNEEYYLNIFKKFKCFDWEFFLKPIIIRSNAVFSEDKNNISWSWVYLSKIINNFTYENKNYFNKIYKISYKDVINLIKDTYLSNFNKQTDRYQKKNNIINEKLNLIIQEYIDGFPENEYIQNLKFDFHELMDTRESCYWIINSHVLWQPLLSQINYNWWLFYLNNNNIEHFFDDIKIEKKFLLFLWKLITYFKTFYKNPFQIEFWLEWNSLYLFQFKYLDKKYLKETKIFNINDNKLNLLFTWKCIWVHKGIYNIVSNFNDNSNNEWVIILNNTYWSSMWFDYTCLPKKWWVIILWGSNSEHSHLHTICSELWLFVIYDEKKNYNAFWNNDIEYLDLYWYKKIKIKSNGIIWNIYWI